MRCSHHTKHVKALVAMVKEVSIELNAELLNMDIHGGKGIFIQPNNWGLSLQHATHPSNMLPTSRQAANI